MSCYHRNLSGVVLAGLLICPFASRSYADLLAYEGFDLPVASAEFPTVQNQGSGTGWSGNWDVGQPGNYQIASGTLSVAGLPSTGNKLGKIANNGKVGRYLQDHVSHVAGETVWMSYLMTENASNYANLQFYWGTSTQGYEKFNFGQVYDETTGTVTPNYAIRVAGSPAATAHLSTTPAITDGSTHLFVLQVDFLADNDANFYMYLDPVLGETPATSSAIATANYTGSAGDLSFNQVRIELSNGNGYIDEVRIGTAFSDVTSIPEPGSLAVICMGVLMMRVRTRLSSYKS